MSSNQELYCRVKKTDCPKELFERCQTIVVAEGESNPSHDFLRLNGEYCLLEGEKRKELPGSAKER